LGNKEQITMKTIDYSFRKKLNKVLGGFSHNYCYQCGACVGDCPAHNHLSQFNPRTIILQALFGFEEDLIGPKSLIWNCTYCYNCHERCPQEVSPIEVIIALKNLSIDKNTNPPVLQNIVERVKKTGLTVSITELSAKRREELNLPKFELDCLNELDILFKE
jgi:heterodisulfide reductase subunit C